MPVVAAALLASLFELAAGAPDTVGVEPVAGLDALPLAAGRCSTGAGWSGSAVLPWAGCSIQATCLPSL
jgi:hypothetical protein